MASPHKDPEPGRCNNTALRRAGRHLTRFYDACLAGAGQPDPVGFVARAYRFWGREAVLEHFREVFRGTWRSEPDLAAMRIVPLNAATAQIFLPTRVTFAPGGVETTQPFLINKLAVRTAEGWRIAATVTVPAS